MSIRFDENDIRSMGRSAMGVKGITLSNDDKVVSMSLCEEGTDVLVVSENGFGKRTDINEYRTQIRAGKGIKTYNIAEKTGKLVGAEMVNEDDEMMIINSDGVLIRLRVNEISLFGRVTSGVKLMKTDDEVNVVSISKIKMEEEITYQTLEEKALELRNEIKKLYDTAESGKILRDGLKTVIVGKPNVGKSSLLNSILGENRAIVTDIAGTTRDVIEEFVNIKGIPLKIVDTAGIRETEDVVEKIGVEKSRESFSTADLVIMVLDASRKLSEEDMEILESLKNKKTIVLLNKMDLEPQIELEKIEEFVNSEDIIKISALKHQGIEELQDKIEAMVYHGSVKNSSNLMITNSRHKDALFKAYESINDAISAIEQRMPYDFIEVDFKNIWDYLGYINGDTVREDLLDTIFANFCIGK